ncbi:hypothetical protein FACS189496_2700 [Bacilli bacterium]|nr:hypothetical protein FACS189496_2700 [Bacilli bacterium]
MNEQTDKELERALESIILSSPGQTGPLLWTSMGLREIAEAMRRRGYAISHGTVKSLLLRMGYTMNMKSSAMKKKDEPRSREDQCAWINKLAGTFFSKKEPVIYLDLSPFELHGSETWNRGYGEKLDSCGYARIISDVGHETDLKEKGFNQESIFRRANGHHDPISLAVDSIALWLAQVIMTSNLYLFSVKYRRVKNLYVICNSGDRNIIAQEAFTTGLAGLAKERQTALCVSCLPPGTFRFNTIEHKTAFFHYFCHERKRAIKVTAQINLIKDSAAADGMLKPEVLKKAGPLPELAQDAWNRVFP